MSAPRPHRRILRLLAPCLLFAWCLSYSGTREVVAMGTETPVGERSQDVRARFGLSTDPVVIARAESSPESHDFLGITVTGAELAVAQGVLDSQAQVISEILPRLRQTPTFGGVYIDRAGGAVVVLMTDGLKSIDPQVLEQAKGIRGPGVRFGVATFTERHLQAAAIELDTAWRAQAGVPLLGVASNSRDQQLVATVLADDLAAAIAVRPLAEKWSGGVPVVVEAGQVETDQDCTSRDNCDYPMVAGDRIRKGSTGGSICTMGFHVQVGSDEQFLTAGHCGLSGSNNWYHQGYGFVGAKTSSLVSFGYDIMRVQISDSQDSSTVFNIYDVYAHRLPILDEAVLASNGNSDQVNWAFVQSDWTSWTGSTCGCTQWGASVGSWALNPIGGDSGSPIVASSDQTAIGSHSTHLGKFTRIYDAFSWWSISMRVP